LYYTAVEVAEGIEDDNKDDDDFDPESEEEHANNMNMTG
jgi:hypothetical protein